MDVYIKSFANYRTIKKAAATAYSFVLDSLDSDTSSVTVAGTAINLSDVGNWLIADGYIYQISAVRPQKDKTVATLIPPLSAFARSIEYDDSDAAATIGDFIAAQLTKHWMQCDDAVYAIPYLDVLNSDTTAFCPPDLDNKGCYDLAEYARLMRKSYRVMVQFSVGLDTLNCTISKAPAVTRNVVFDDGRSQIKTVDYTSSGTAKITVLHDVSGKDADGNAITTRNRSTWYLAADGSVSQDVPASRAAGTWSTLSVSGEDADIPAKVTEAFAKNKKNHKLEFYSTRDMAVQDDCTFAVYGDLLQAHISYKRIASGDNRFFYKSGELAVTATEKMRGAK